jgi:hypothetical protein
MTLTSHLPHQLSLAAPQVLVVELMLVALAQVQGLQLEQDHLVVGVEVANLQEEGYREVGGCLEEAVLLVLLQPFQVEVEVALIL